MDINRFTERVQQALSAAQTKAVRYGHQQIETPLGVQLLKGAVRDGQTVVVDYDPASGVLTFTPQTLDAEEEEETVAARAK